MGDPFNQAEWFEFVKWMDQCVLRCSNLNVRRARQAMLGAVNGHPERFGQSIQWMAEHYSGSVEACLFVVNDCLHHINDPDFHLGYDTEPLRWLFEVYEQENEASATQLIELWHSRGYLPLQVINSWRTAKISGVRENSGMELRFSADMPFYELPASLIVGSVVPGAVCRLNEVDIPAGFPNEASFVDEGTRSALDSFYAEIQSITATKFNENDDNDKYTYSGWTKGFVEERVNRYKELHNHSEDDNHPNDGTEQVSTKSYNAVPPPPNY